jgi:hypothetical protein
MHHIVVLYGKHLFWRMAQSDRLGKLTMQDFPILPMHRQHAIPIVLLGKQKALKSNEISGIY